MAQEYEGVSYKTRERLAIITLNIPDTLNALTQDHYYRLGQILREIAELKDIYITVITGKGRFFSSGADISGLDDFPAVTTDNEQHFLRTFVSNNLFVTHAFYTHPKVLVAALNGPAIGLSAALVAHADFVYATSHSYILTPFSSLGLVCEGGSSRAFVSRMGIAKASEALMMSKRISAKELLQVGFVNKIFDGSDMADDTGFLVKVLKELEESLGAHLNQESLLQIKAMVKKPEMDLMARQVVTEVLGGLQRFVKGVPQEEFLMLASGRKRHKL